MMYYVSKLCARFRVETVKRLLQNPRKHFSMRHGRYEREKMANKYLKINYGPFLKASDFCESEDFYQNLITVASPFVYNSNVLYIGCAAGRLVFEYEKQGARKCVGIDSSKLFIKLCKRIKAGKVIDLDFVPVKGSDCIFLRRDIMYGCTMTGEYDFVSCVNVIDRVKNPAKLLRFAYDSLKPGGVLMLVSPYDWKLSPAPKHLHVCDAKQLMVHERWIFENEISGMKYVIPVGLDRSFTYECHLIVARRLEEYN